MALLSCSSGRPVPAAGKEPLFQRIWSRAIAGEKGNIFSNCSCWLPGGELGRKWGEVALPSTFRGAVPPFYTGFPSARRSPPHAPQQRRDAPFFLSLRPSPCRQQGKRSFLGKFWSRMVMRKEGICPATLADCQGREVRFSLRGGKPCSLHLGGWLPRFSRFFCFYMLLILLSRTPLWGGNALSSSLCRQRVNALISVGFGRGQSRGREVSDPSHHPQRPVRRRGSLLAEIGGKPPRLCIWGAVSAHKKAM